MGGMNSNGVVERLVKERPFEFVIVRGWCVNVNTTGETNRCDGTVTARSEYTFGVNEGRVVNECACWCVVPCMSRA